MNKDEYLKELRKLLRKLPKEDREDIISDYEEHFTIGMEKGRTEEEISKALGNPKNVAKQIKADHIIKKAEDFYKKLGERYNASEFYNIFNNYANTDISKLPTLSDNSNSYNLFNFILC